MLNLQGSQSLEDAVRGIDDVALDQVKDSGEFGGIEQASAINLCWQFSTLLIVIKASLRARRCTYLRLLRDGLPLSSSLS